MACPVCFGGDDVFLLDGGNDIALGGAGRDWIEGGVGYDVILGEGDDDQDRHLVAPGVSPDVAEKIVFHARAPHRHAPVA